jgi:hypothetical protein
MATIFRLPIILSFGFVCSGFLVGCGGSSQINPDITQALTTAGVTGPTYAKMQAGEKLGYGDILVLVQARVPTHIIESYLQSTEAVYKFSPNQLTALEQAGATSQLVNYLSDTGGFYNPPAASSTAQSLTPSQRNSPLSQDQQPFAYNAPEVDYWYNSAYEESLYSPFSFNAD